MSRAVVQIGPEAQEWDVKRSPAIRCISGRTPDTPPLVEVLCHTPNVSAEQGQDSGEDEPREVRWERLRLAAPEHLGDSCAEAQHFVEFAVETTVGVVGLAGESAVEFADDARVVLADRAHYRRLRRSPLGKKNPGQALTAASLLIQRRIEEWRSKGKKEFPTGVEYDLELVSLLAKFEEITEGEAKRRERRGSSDCFDDVWSAIAYKVTRDYEYFCFANTSLLRTTVRNAWNSHAKGDRIAPKGFYGAVTTGWRGPCLRCGDTDAGVIPVSPVPAEDGEDFFKSLDDVYAEQMTVAQEFTLVSVADQMRDHEAQQDAVEEVEQRIAEADAAKREREESERLSAKHERARLLEEFRESLIRAVAEHEFCPRHETKKQDRCNLSYARQFVWAMDEWDDLLNPDLADGTEEPAALALRLEEAVSKYIGSLEPDYEATLGTLSRKELDRAKDSTRTDIRRHQARCMQWLSFMSYRKIDPLDEDEYRRRVPETLDDKNGLKESIPVVGNHRYVFISQMIRGDGSHIETEFPLEGVRIASTRYEDVRLIIARQLAKLGLALKGKEEMR